MNKSNTNDKDFKRKYMKWIILIFIFAIVCIGILHFIKVNNNFNDNNTINDIYYEQIIEDCFSEDTQLEQIIKTEVNVKVNKISDDILEITVESPNICEDLIDFVEGMDENIEENQLEQEILKLIQQSPNEVNTYELYYKDVNDIEIEYTEEYINAISCGLYDFNNYAMEQIILDMLKEEENE